VESDVEWVIDHFIKCVPFPIWGGNIQSERDRKWELPHKILYGCPEEKGPKRRKRPFVLQGFISTVEMKEKGGGETDTW